jgi:DNA-binding PadR family transcriptional regulator
MPGIHELLPLNESVAYVLIALMDGKPQHGGAIGKSVKRKSNGLVEIAPGNLYPMLRRLRENGLLDIVDEIDDHGTPRKLYKITGVGQDVLVADQQRLRQRERAMATAKPSLKPLSESR